MTTRRSSSRLLLAGLVWVLSAACAGGPDESAGSRNGEAAGAAATKAAVTPAVLARGREIYLANCVPCHGAGGKGDGPAAAALKPPPRDHTDRAYMDTLTDEDLAKVIVMGGAIKGRPLMPSHPQFRGADLEAIVAYTRSLSAKGSDPSR